MRVAAYIRAYYSFMMLQSRYSRKNMSVFGREKKFYLLQIYLIASIRMKFFPQHLTQDYKTSSKIEQLKMFPVNIVGTFSQSIFHK